MDWGGETVCCISTFTIGISGALGCSFFPSVTGKMCVMQTAQLSVITCRLSQAGNPSMAGPGVSATYHLDWILLGFFPFPGLHVNGQEKAPYCGMGVPLQAVSHVLLGSRPMGFPF